MAIYETHALGTNVYAGLSGVGLRIQGTPQPIRNLSPYPVISR